MIFINGLEKDIQGPQIYQDEGNSTKIFVATLMMVSDVLWEAELGWT